MISLSLKPVFLQDLSDARTFVVSRKHEAKRRQVKSPLASHIRLLLHWFEAPLIIPLPSHGNRHFLGAAYAAEFDLYWPFAASTAWVPSAFRHDDVDLIHANEFA